MIIVDDGSTDGSAEAVAAVAGTDPRVQLIRQENGGVCKARNAGYACVSRESPYLLFLDADDCLEPEMLAELTDYLSARSEVGVTHCDHGTIDAWDHHLPEGACRWTPRYVPSGWMVRALRPDEPETPFLSIFTLAGLIPSVSLIRRTAYERTPGWDEAFGQHYEDTDLFLHLALVSKVHYVHRKLVCHRRREGQSSADTRKHASQERKLYVKWLSGVGLTPEQRELVEAAWRFREGRLIPYLAVLAANRYVKQFALPRAARFYFGAARRYLFSISHRE
jgi:glycosyltransferase involved in cell wall biosynthesis